MLSNPFSKGDAPAASDEEYEDLFVSNPTSDFLFILNAQYQLDTVAAKLNGPTYKPSDEDRIAIFQLLGFSFKPTKSLLEKMTADKFGPLRALKRAERAQAVDAAAKFASDLTAVEERVRARASTAEQVEALQTSSRTLGDFLAIASASGKYTIPKLEIAPGAAPLL